MNIETRRENIKTLKAYLHSVPEIAKAEYQTSAFLCGELENYGYEVAKEVGGTGVVGTWDTGRPGSVVALRADMDALPFNNEQGENIAIHACGHDAHMAIVLDVAQALKKQELSGIIKIIFQPAEEIGAGAKLMLEAGALIDVDYLLALHVMPREVVPSGQIIPHMQWSAATQLKVEITGRTVHGSQPHLGVNALEIATSIINNINALHLDPFAGWSIKATRCIADNAINCIPDYCELGFDLRSLDNDTMRELEHKAREIITATAHMYGGEATAQVTGACPGAIRDAEMVVLAQETIEGVLGRQAVAPECKLSIGEDFYYYPSYLPHLKTAYLGLGCDLGAYLHDPNINMDDNALVNGSLVLEAMVKKLSKE